MSISDFDIVRRSLASRLFSTAVTALTVAVAVSLMLVLLTMKDAGHRAFSRGSGNMHLIVSRDDSALVSVLNGVFFAEAPKRPIRMDELQEFLTRDRGRLPPIEAQVNWAIPTQLGDSYRGLPVLATTEQIFTDYEPNPNEPFVLAGGAFFDGPFQAVLGADAARLTGLSIGDTLQVTHGVGETAHVHDEFDYVVCGILEPTGGPQDRLIFSDLNSTWILHAHDKRLREDPTIKMTGVEHLEPDDMLITGVYIRAATRPGYTTSAVLQQVFEIIRQDPGYTVASPARQIDQLFRIVGNIDQLFVAMAGVVMVSSAVSILLALYNSMSQRRRQIAVLRVLGASRTQIFTLILTESAILGIIGVVGGIVLALLGSQIAAQVLKADLGLVIDPTLSLDALLLVSVGTVLLSALAGVIPGVMAYKTPVARNLRPLG